MAGSAHRPSFFWIFLVLCGLHAIDSASQQPKIVTTILSEPYMMLRPNADSSLQGNDRYEGYCADLLRLVSREAGFNYTIQLVKDNTFGYLRNGSWSGMIGELIRHEADLAVAPLTITSQRVKVVAFSKPFMSVGISIMIKKPWRQPALAELTLAFLAPFSIGVWVALLVACPAIGILMYLLARFNGAENRQPNDGANATTDANRFDISNSLWYSMRTMLQQGTPTEPRSVSCRILSTVWWGFVAVVVASYTANLVAITTESRKLLTPIASADDLAKQTAIRYGMVGNGSTLEFFKQSTIPVYERMWAFMSSVEPSPFVASTDEGIRRVRESNGRYAFLTESTTIDYINQRAPCDTMKVGSNLDSKGYGIATPIGSDLRARIDVVLLQLRETGDLEKLERKWWFDKAVCSSPSDRSEHLGSNMVNIRGAFYTLIIGAVVAVVVAVGEFGYWRRKHSSKPSTASAAGPDKL